MTGAGAAHGGCDLRGEEDAHRRRLGAIAIDGGDRLLQDFAVFPFGAGQCLRDDGAGLQQFERHVLPGIEFFRDLVAPGGPAVGEGFDGVAVAGVVGEEHLAGPAVVVDEAHLGFAPIFFVLAPVLQNGSDLVVAVLEDVSGDLEDVALDPLDRIAPGIDFRLDTLDDDRAGRIEGVGQGDGGERLEVGDRHGASYMVIGSNLGRMWRLAARYERTSRSRAGATGRALESIRADLHRWLSGHGRAGRSVLQPFGNKAIVGMDIDLA